MICRNSFQTLKMVICCMQLSYSYLNALESVSDEFGLNVLTRQCQEILKEANDGYISEGTVRLVCNSGVESNNTRLGFAANSPVDPLELKNIFNNGEFSDVDVFIDGINFVAQGHKLVLSAWSIPFAKVTFCTRACDNLNLAR